MIPMTRTQPLLDAANKGLIWRIAVVLLGSWMIALSARINVPMVPVPMSMQSFAVLLVGVTAGRTLAVQTLAAYLMQGAVGLPMFATGAGLAYMAGKTGGYLVGFIVAAAIVGWLADRGWNRQLASLSASVLLCHAIIFLFGVAWLQSFVGLQVALKAGVWPFIPGLVLKTALVVAVVAVINMLRGARA